MSSPDPLSSGSNPVAPGPSLPAPDTTEEGLLALLQKMLGHELPNQLIAVQGMARLLQMEAGEQLGPEPRTYLDRLAAGALRAHETVRALAELIRAVRVPRPVQPVALAEVVREAVAEVRRAYPDLRVEQQLTEQGPLLPLPALALRQIVLHLLRTIATLPEAANRAPVLVGADPGGAFAITIPWLDVVQTEQHFELASRRGATSLGPMLACQIVATWGGTLLVQPVGDRGSRLLVTFGHAGGGLRQEKV